MLQTNAFTNTEIPIGNYHIFDENRNPDLVQNIAFQLEEITSSGENPALLPRNKNYFLEQINN
jgi:hypothetical protein